MSTNNPNEAVRLEVKLKYKTIAEFDARFAANVSTQSVFLKTPQPKDPGTVLFLDLKLADGQSVLQGSGRVLEAYSPAHPAPGKPNGMLIGLSPADAASATRMSEIVAKFGPGKNTVPSRRATGPALSPGAAVTPMASGQSAGEFGDLISDLAAAFDDIELPGPGAASPAGQPAQAMTPTPLPAAPVAAKPLPSPPLPSPPLPSHPLAPTPISPLVVTGPPPLSPVLAAPATPDSALADPGPGFVTVAHGASAPSAWQQVESQLHRLTPISAAPATAAPIPAPTAEPTPEPIADAAVVTTEMAQAAEPVGGQAEASKPSLGRLSLAKKPMFVATTPPQIPAITGLAPEAPTPPQSPAEASTLPSPTPNLDAWLGQEPDPKAEPAANADSSIEDKSAVGENDPDAKQTAEAAAALSSWVAQAEPVQQATEPSAPEQADLPAAEISPQAPDSAALGEALAVVETAQALTAEDADDAENPFAGLDAMVGAQANAHVQNLDEAFDPTEDNFFAAGSNAQEIQSDPFAANDAVLRQSANEDALDDIDPGVPVQELSQDHSDGSAAPASLVPEPEQQAQAQAPEDQASAPEIALNPAGFDPHSTELVKATDRVRPARHSRRPSKVGAVLAVVLGAIVGVALIFALQMRMGPPQIDRDLAEANQLVKTGRAAEAVTWYHDILRREPGHISAQRNLGVALALTGQQAKADASLRDYLQGAQDAQDAQKVRAYLGD